jgi:hypothetical protein
MPNEDDTTTWYEESAPVSEAAWARLGKKMTSISVEIAPHEREAMYQTMLTMRAFASLLDSDLTQANKMRNWAQMIEDVLQRLDEKS